MVVGGYMYYRLGALVLNYVHFLRPLFSKMHRLGQMNSQKNITYLETKLHFLDCTLPNVTRLSYKDRHKCHYILPFFTIFWVSIFPIQLKHNA
jgi:hypothetical protein